MSFLIMFIHRNIRPVASNEERKENLTNLTKEMLFFLAKTGELVFASEEVTQQLIKSKHISCYHTV